MHPDTIIGNAEGGHRNAVLAMVLVLALNAAAAPVPVRAQDAAPASTLDRCLQEALAASPGLQAARARADAAAARRDAAGARLFPVLGLNGRAGYITETMSLEVPSLPGQPAHRITFGDGYDLDLMLGVRAPLYQGGALRAEREAQRANWLASVAEVAADSLDLRLQVRRAFYGALGAETAAGAARRGEERLQRHLNEIESNIAAGAATEEARVQVLARLRRTQQTTLQAEAAAAAQRLGLGRLVGRPGAEVSPTADLTATLLADQESGRPWDERPELRALDARIAAAGHAARAAGSSLRPAIDLEGGWHYGRPGIDQVTDEWMDYGKVALSLRWPLFDFGATQNRVKSQRAESRALAAVRSDTDWALRTRLATTRTQRRSAVQEQERAEERVALERKRLQLVEGRWQAGHATESELLDTQDDVTLAEMDLAITRARLRLAEAELMAALGW